MRWLAASLSLVVVGALATGCGEDDPFERYCDEVRAQQQALTEDLAAGTATSLIEALPEFERLRDKSPEDLRDEWDTVTSRIGTLVGALEDAGVDPSTYDRESPPPGLDEEERAAIDAAARALATPEMAAALDGVEQQARDVCKTPLAL